MFGRRIAKKVDADGFQNGMQFDGTAYVYDGPHRALEYNLDFAAESNSEVTAATPTRHYLYGPAVDQLMAIEEITGSTLPNKTRWTLTDVQGSVRVLYGDASDQRAFDYDAFGEPLDVDLRTTPAANLDLPFFTGRPYDNETGFYYYRARDYDPGTHRFISQDPSGFGGGDTNLYRYVGNSPTNATDPSGQATVWDGVVNFANDGDYIYGFIPTGGVIGGAYNSIGERVAPIAPEFFANASSGTLVAGVVGFSIPAGIAIFYGAPVLATAGGAYYATSAGLAGVQTGLEWAAASYVGDNTFNPAASFGKNFAFNALTGNIGGAGSTGWKMVGG